MQILFFFRQSRKIQSMKIVFIKPKRRQSKKMARLLRVVFPALGFAAAMRFAMGLRKNKHTDFLIAKGSSRSKKLLGIAVMTTLSFFGRKFLFVRALSVDPRQQKRKIGTRLMRKAEKLARKKQYHGIFLFSAVHRKGAHRFYLKQGFRKWFGIFFWKRFGKKWFRK